MILSVVLPHCFKSSGFCWWYLCLFQLNGACNEQYWQNGYFLILHAVSHCVCKLSESAVQWLTWYDWHLGCGNGQVQPAWQNNSQLRFSPCTCRHRAIHHCRYDASAVDIWYQVLLPHYCDSVSGTEWCQLFTGGEGRIGQENSGIFSIIRVH